MKFKVSLICIISVQWMYCQIGINIKKPTKTLDINGELRVRTIKSENSPAYVLVSDLNGVIGKKVYKEIKPQIGDVKKGFQKADHNGWYLLDGRQCSSLPGIAAAGAQSIGFAAALPDAKGKFLKVSDNTQQTAIKGGSNTVTLNKKNLPKLNFNGQASAVGVSHSHSFTDAYSVAYAANFNGVLAATYGNTNNRNPHLSSQANTSGSGSHSHSFKISNAGGNSQAFSVIPQYVEVNTFIYLGN
ncbi:hypothetical protein [Chryseobacterium cucumeris]|uniref:hypothetical protein n=1 Tax=Chryseobacterium cucumeris TaxID=1813611 RepID=UPI001F4A7D4D|nr:hypothetical protein [Chryseobacterium cucumeris]